MQMRRRRLHPADCLLSASLVLLPLPNYECVKQACFPVNTMHAPLASRTAHAQLSCAWVAG